MNKLKKLLKTWGLIAFFMLICLCINGAASRLFYTVFITIFAVSGIFILFGWDKYITFEDEEISVQTVKNDDEDDILD